MSTFHASFSFLFLKEAEESTHNLVNNVLLLICGKGAYSDPFKSLILLNITFESKLSTHN